MSRRRITASRLVASRDDGLPLRAWGAAGTASGQRPLAKALACAGSILRVRRRNGRREDDTTLGRRPATQCNSIAWTLWHMNRVVDGFIHTRLQTQPQLGIRDGWHQRFGMRDDPDGRGVSWTSKQVEAWILPATEVQLGYYEAAKQAASAFLSTLSNADLETTRVIPPIPEPRTVAAAIGQMTWDNISHGGQIAYIRGLFTGMGWYSR